MDLSYEYVSLFIKILRLKGFDASVFPLAFIESSKYRSLLDSKLLSEKTSPVITELASLVPIPDVLFYTFTSLVSRKLSSSVTVSSISFLLSLGSLLV